MSNAIMNHFIRHQKKYDLHVSSTEIMMPQGMDPFRLGFDVIAKDYTAARTSIYEHAQKNCTALTLKTQNIFEDSFGNQYTISKQTESEIDDEEMENLQPFTVEDIAGSIQGSTSLQDAVSAEEERLKAEKDRLSTNLERRGVLVDDQPKKASFFSRVWNSVVNALKSVGDCFKALFDYMFCKSKKQNEEIVMLPRGETTKSHLERNAIRPARKPVNIVNVRKIPEAITVTLPNGTKEEIN